MNMTRVFRRDIGELWRHYSVITSDGTVILLEMYRAIISGWFVKRCTIQGANEWPDMTGVAIASWFRQHRPDVEITGSEMEQTIKIAERERAKLIG